MEEEDALLLLFVFPFEDVDVCVSVAGMALDMVMVNVSYISLLDDGKRKTDPYELVREGGRRYEEVEGN